MNQNVKNSLNAIDWNFPNSIKKENIHNIHPYPAKFIPEIPSNLLEIIGLPEDTWVFDPFCGSGVTLAEAQKLKLPSIGVDLNPIACLISKVKTSSLPENLLQTAKKIIRNAEIYGNSIDSIPKIPNLDHWFKKSIQTELNKIITVINTISDENLHNHLQLAISSIIVRVSYQDNDTRYAAVENSYEGDDVYRLFLESVSKIIALKTNINTDTKSIVINKNILNINRNDFPGEIGLVITSPPYPNAYEYWLYHKYRMYWLGYDPIKVKRDEIGARAHYFRKNPPTTKDFQIQLFNLFSLIHNVLAENGNVCFVIGRSKIHGKTVNNAKLVIEAANNANFSLAYNIEREIDSSRKSFNLSHAAIKKENILIFEKS